MNELTCQELVELVTAYLEQKLPEAEQAHFEAHLLTCQGCRTYLDHMRQTVALLGKLTVESMAPEAQHELLQVFRNWKANTA